MTRFIFSQQNNDGGTSLYATDGTAAGTTDLDMSRFDFTAGHDFTEFDGKTAFLGDAGGYTDVFSTDSTAAGTTGTLVHNDDGPLTPYGLSVVNGKLLASGFTEFRTPALFASSDGVNFTQIGTGINVSDFAVAHGTGYFDGFNKAGVGSLWRTDGTAAGTYSITPKGVALEPNDITSVGNGKAVFVNDDSDGTRSLWVTNGTAAGTYKLNDAALGSNIEFLAGSATATSHAIFTAIGSDNNISTWSSDGTAAGTYEILVNGPAGDPERSPSGYVTWGSKVLFSTGYQVAVTDGTKAGTVELGGGEPFFFAGVGSRIFIAGGGFAQTPVLFTSDGTTKGTVPLTINGLKTVTGDFTVVNGQVVFAGVDTSGKEALFSSDGTTAGSHELSLPANVTIDPDNLPVIGALPEIASSVHLTGMLPSPLYTGTETVTGTGGVAGLQLERITQGSYNTPGSSGWVKATVASNGNWSVQLTFDKPGMLAHVYAANGGSSTVVDLVDGTPVAKPSAGASLASLAAKLQGSVAADMSAKVSTGASSAAAVLPAVTHPAATLGVLDTHTGVMPVPDHVQVLHHSA